MVTNFRLTHDQILELPIVQNQIENLDDLLASPDASDMEIARVEDFVEAVRDEPCCRHAEKPTAQRSRLCSERAK